MDTSRLRRFATDARKVLMQGVAQRLTAVGFGQDGSFVEEPVLYEGGAAFMGGTMSEASYHQWKSLQRAIQTKSAKSVVEEAAYTWFNRLTAIRILSKNGLVSNALEFEAADIRVPAIVREARQGRCPQMDAETLEKLRELLQDDSLTSEQFRLLIVEFCHSNPIINNCFGRIADWTELLLPQNILAGGGFVDMLNHTEFIAEEDWHSPELIGWLYQFYISERKDEVFAKKGKVEADEIPAATQIFTPNWIVKYMVQNTVGRIYLDNNPAEADKFKPKWKYLVEQSEPTPADAVYHCDDLTKLKLADLACGSGHILNEFFDLLYDLYLHEGYSFADAVENIFTHNIIGIDIDGRAKQLATFALLLKACQKDRSFANAQCMPRIYDMPQPWEDKSGLGRVLRKFIQVQDERAVGELYSAIALMDNADSLGSIMKFKISERVRETVAERMGEWVKADSVPEEIRGLFPYMNIILALTDKYSALVMNPPYMGSGNMNGVLGDYVKNNYTDGKADLFSTFMLLAAERLAENGKYGMITMQSWMFLSSFEKMRKELLDNYHVENMLHLGPHTFDELSGEIVQNTAFVIGKNKFGNGTYYRLVDGKDCADKERMFLSGVGCYPAISQQNFEKIPGCPIGYWVSENVLNCFNAASLGDSIEAVKGLDTCDNNRFLRFWAEVSKKNISFKCNSTDDTYGFKWYPYCKGGGFRKWYGLLEMVVNWENDGEVLRNLRDENGKQKSFARNVRHYFKEGITTNSISSGKPSMRYMKNCIFGGGGHGMFSNGDILPTLGFLNSNTANFLMDFLNPTLNVLVGDILSLPKKYDDYSLTKIVKDCISISKADWDAHETSWDFRKNELLRLNDHEAYRSVMHEYGQYEGLVIDLAAAEIGKLEWVVGVYKTKWETKFHKLHDNEEELNRQFIEIYGLEDELTPEVPMDEITILQQGEISIVDGEIQWHDDVIAKQLLSYAVGCMMGRYSIDKDGLILANQGDGVKEYGKLVPNSRFEVDEDAIIPLMASDSDFADNATLRFRNWLSITFGSENLVRNLNYIESCLGKTIDDYFVKDFWNDHKRMYQNRPIYWLFSSRKKAFQCVAYMHRMNASTVENIRSKYLLPHIEWLKNRQTELEENAARLTGYERRTLDSIKAQLADCTEYQVRLRDLKDQQIEFDLDDGVVVNYAKFGDVLAKIK